MRPSWDESFMLLAKSFATRSQCCKRSVGACLVQGRHPIALSYNGVPAGLPHPEVCVRSGIPSGEQADKVCCIHAEMNAVAQAAQLGQATAGATLYVTCSPCVGCARVLINAGVKRVVYESVYPDPNALELLRTAGVKVEQL